MPRVSRRRKYIKRLRRLVKRRYTLALLRFVMDEESDDEDEMDVNILNLYYHKHANAITLVLLMRESGSLH